MQPLIELGANLEGMMDFPSEHSISPEATMM